MGDIRGQHPSQVVFAHDQEVVETCFSDGADPALRIGVRAGCAVRRADDFEPLGGEHAIEGRWELRIPIVDEVAAGAAGVLQRPSEIARLLRHPGGGQVGGAASEMDPAGADLEEEEDVDRLEEERLDGEEVAREHLVLVAGQECPPGVASVTSARCRRHALPLQDCTDG
jgi:hypothetical protein